MTFLRSRALCATAVTTALAAALLTGVASTPAAQATPAPTQAPAASAAGPSAPQSVRSEGRAGGLSIENSFVSSQGWVKPGHSYPSQIILTNTRAKRVTGASVTVTAPKGTRFTDARGEGTHPVRAKRVVWTPGAIGAGKSTTLTLESKAATTAQVPTIVWRDLSTRAVLEVASARTTVASHGPKVIPPGQAYETAKYGDRPFPVVPVAYQGRPYQDSHERDLDTVINDPKFEGSTFNLFQEMSLGQLYPDGTVPSDGLETAGFDYAPGFDFTPRAVPGDTCTGGVTFADTPASEEGTPVYPNRVVDGVYQLPGNTEFYGADSTGTAIAVGQIDSGCGAPGKLVRDAAAIADPEIDYSDFDTDKDGVVDFFMAVFAGCGGNGASQLTVAECPYTSPTPAPYDNVWPHSSSLEFYYSDEETGLPGFTTDDQLKNLEGQPLWYTDKTYSKKTTQDKGDALKVFVRVGPYNVNPETAIDTASVISHEYGHSLGLPDFYSSSGGRETYGDWNLMATDKSQNMDIFSRQELGWVVPEVLEPGTSPTVRDWKDSKEDIDSITWQTPDGRPYTLQQGRDGRVQNSEAYVAKLPGRQLIDPSVFETGDKASKTHAWWSQSGNDFGCPPQGGHNLDLLIPELATADPDSTVKLEFKSLWDIEWDYDYGFVMTTVDGGETYTSHESQNDYTTENTEPLEGNPFNNQCQADYDHGLTGSSGSYQAGTEDVDRNANNVEPTYPDPVFLADSYDISDLAGEETGALRFSYATDPGLARPGWFIDDVKVTLTEPGKPPREVLATDFEETGGPDDERVFNGGCKEDLSTATSCTVGWNYVAAGAKAPADHAYYLEMRDRSGFDLDGQGQIDRTPIEFQPGLSMVYTDEAHGYGNNGTPDPPAQSPLDSQPQPGEQAPDLNDAAWTAAAGDSAFSDFGDGHTDNYQDPRPTDKGETAEDSFWHFRYDCLSFDVLSMSGAENGPEVSNGDLTGDVAFTMGDGCAGSGPGGGEGSGGDATDPEAQLSISTDKPFRTQKVTLSGAGSTDGESSSRQLTYSWNFGDGGAAVDATGRTIDATFRKPGFRTVRLTVTDEAGNSDKATVQLLVRRYVACQNGKVTLHGSWRTARGGGAKGGSYCDNQGRDPGPDVVTYTFQGPRLLVLHGESASGGVAEVVIDGRRQANLSFRNRQQQVRVDDKRLFRGLGAGEHTVRIVVRRGEAYLDGFIVRR